MEVTGNKGGTDFKIKLFVLQQWIKTKKGWQLWIRQSAKQGIIYMFRQKGKYKEARKKLDITQLIFISAVIIISDVLIYSFIR